MLLILAALAQAASVALELATRPGARRAIDDSLGVAVDQLRAARAALANPATLPPSFRK